MSLLELASTGRPYIVEEKIASGPAFRQALACVASQVTGIPVRAEELPRVVVNESGALDSDYRVKTIRADSIGKGNWDGEVAENRTGRDIGYYQSAAEVWSRLADERVARETLGETYNFHDLNIMAGIAREQTVSAMEDTRKVKQLLHRIPEVVKTINDSLPSRRESHIYGMQVLRGMDAYEVIPEVAYQANDMTAQAIDPWSPLSGIVEAGIGGLPGFGGNISKAIIHPSGIADYALSQSRTNPEETNIDASINYIVELKRGGREWPTHRIMNERTLLLDLAVMKAWDYWWSRYPQLDQETKAAVCSAIMMNEKDQFGQIYSGTRVGLVRDMTLSEVGLLGDLSLDGNLLDRINHNQGVPRYLANKVTRSVGLKKPYFKDWPRVEVTSDGETQAVRNKWTARSYVGDDNGFRIHPEAPLEVAQIMADYNEREEKKKEMGLDDIEFAKVLFEKAAVVTMASIMLDVVVPEKRDQLMKQVVEEAWNAG